MATATSETPSTDPTVMVSFFCEEQSSPGVMVLAIGDVVPDASEVELVEETSLAFRRPATPSTGVAFGNVKMGLPSIHANDEFICVVSALPQQYCAAAEELVRQKDRRTSLSR